MVRGVTISCFVAAALGLAGADLARAQAQAPQASASALREAAERGDARAQLLLGTDYLLGSRGLPKDPAEAYRWLGKSAAQGNHDAEHNLGTMYSLGLYVKKDYAEAAKWFRLSADGGNAAGQVAFGTMLLEGRGVARDEARAAQLLELSAAQGNARGQFNLGWMHENGKGGFAKDPRAALDLYRKAAAGGNEKAREGVARLEKVVAALPAKPGDASQQKPAQAAPPKSDKARFDEILQAAQKGDATSQLLLASMYSQGIGVPKDPAKAEYWRKQGENAPVPGRRERAEKGDATAQGALATDYLQGRHGLPKDGTQALYWYKKAAAQGDAAAQTNIAFMYEMGAQVPKDPAEAAKWFRLGAQGNDPRAQAMLGAWMITGSHPGVASDPAEGLRLVKAAASKGERIGEYSLGMAYERGLAGLAVDKDKALQLYRGAAAKGYPAAAARVKELEAAKP